MSIPKVCVTREGDVEAGGQMWGGPNGLCIGQWILSGGCGVVTYNLRKCESFPLNLTQHHKLVSSRF